MSVDLGDLIESLQRETSPPGTNLYPDATDDEWIGHLSDAFWEARLQGVTSLEAWTEADFVIDPIEDGGDDMPRDLQQLIVLYAGFRIVLTSFQNVNSLFRAKAGPVEYEIQKQATVLKAVLDAIRERIKIVLSRLSDLGSGGDVEVFDAVIERSYSIAYGDAWFVR